MGPVQRITIQLPVPTQAAFIFLIDDLTVQKRQSPLEVAGLQTGTYCSDLYSFLLKITSM